MFKCIESPSRKNDRRKSSRKVAVSDLGVVIVVNDFR